MNNLDALNKALNEAAKLAKDADCPFVFVYSTKEGHVTERTWVGSYGTDLSFLDRDIRWILKCMEPYCKLFK